MKLLWIPVLMVLTAAGFGYGRVYQYSQDKSYYSDAIEFQKEKDNASCKTEMGEAIRWLRQRQEQQGQ
jgi:hypothetical protein